ncbi:MAG: cytochrome c1, partial [Burkholderiales bacterium]|nr:cytochrome c1 [Burkholderiales bacterium]
EQVKPGTMSPAEYDNAMGDLVAFMQWMAEPGQNSRVQLGVWVLLFLAGFTVIAWRLNAAYWKDIK